MGKRSVLHENSQTKIHLLVAVTSLIGPQQTLASSAINETMRARRVPALFLFGDSTLDTGNNNGLKTKFKCDFSPYGKDFIDHILTGRCSNGKITGDFLGIFVQSFFGRLLGTGRASFNRSPNIFLYILELRLFSEYKEKLKSIAGLERAATIVSQSLLLVSCGSKDIAYTYFSNINHQKHNDIPSYIDFLVARTSDFLQILYKMGARKIGISGLRPVGCLPSQRTVAGGNKRECEQLRNQASILYNSKIIEEIRRLAANFREAKLVYNDAYNILLDLINRPSNYGFEVSHKGCCGTGLIEFGILCNNKSPTCPDDTKYVFWDSFHPTEKAYKIMADSLFQQLANI